MNRWKHYIECKEIGHELPPFSLTSVFTPEELFAKLVEQIANGTAKEAVDNKGHGMFDV